MKWVFGLIGLVVAGLLVSYWWAGKDLKPLTPEAREAAPGDFLRIAPGKGMLHYRWDGPEDGPIIVMSHGFSTPNFIYQQNAEALAAAGFRVLRYDHFGRGWSDRPDGKYDVDFYDDELRLLLDGLQIDEPVGLVGLSMGGPIVAEFAARHPARVSRVLMFVPAGLDTAGADGATAALVKAPIVGDWIWRVFGRGILLGDPQYDESAIPEANRLQGNVMEQMDYRGYGGALLSSLRHFPMTGREATFEALAETGIPVMAVYGTDDPTVLISSADRLETLIPDARVVRIEGGDHGLNYKRHAEVNPMLVEWFEEGAPPSPLRERD